MLKSLVTVGVCSILLYAMLSCQGPFPKAGQADEPVFEVKFSQQIDSLLQAGAISQSTAAYEYSYIGAYQNAILTYEWPLEWGLDRPEPGDAEVVDTWEPLDAYEYLQQIAVHKELIIVSEAHHKPQHRLFTRQLLAVLYEEGYRYLGLETLTPSNDPEDGYFLFDTLLQERAYCLNLPKTGYYTREPQMSNLVRAALEMGYTVFGYEQTEKGAPRDEAQARNIQRFLEQKGRGKTIIHCGWYHAVESDLPKREGEHWMAYHLKELTGIDPVTIYLDALTEKGKIPPSPLFPMVKGIEKPTIFLEASGKAFNGRLGAQHVDICPYLPPTKYVNGRPDWLFWPEENKAVPLDKGEFAHLGFPVIVKAFVWAEGAAAVPYDMLEWQHAEEAKALVLRRGKYQIEVTNLRGESYTFELFVR